MCDGKTQAQQSAKFTLMIDVFVHRHTLPQICWRIYMICFPPQWLRPRAFWEGGFSLRTQANCAPLFTVRMWSTVNDTDAACLLFSSLVSAQIKINRLEVVAPPVFNFIDNLELEWNVPADLHWCKTHKWDGLVSPLDFSSYSRLYILQSSVELESEVITK